MKKGKPVLEPFGFSCLPVFDAEAQYVQGGNFQLPVFSGLPPKQLILDFQYEPMEPMLGRYLKADEVSK